MNTFVELNVFNCSVRFFGTPFITGYKINDSDNLLFRVLYSPSGRSCLFAKIRIMASLISLSFMILLSSCLASSIRSRSAQSTTKMSPCVPGNQCKVSLYYCSRLSWFLHLFTCVVVPPQGSNFILSPNIPHVESHFFVCHRFDVKPH